MLPPVLIYMTRHIQIYPQVYSAIPKYILIHSHTYPSIPEWFLFCPQVFPNSTQEYHNISIRGGKDIKNVWMCQHRLELIIMSGIDVKPLLNIFGVVITGLDRLETI